MEGMALDEFARRFSLRARNLMWFLGAGCSAAAGVPTAMDMIWEFKQTLFISQRRGSYQTVADLSQPMVRDRLQEHINSLERLPILGAPEEYARLFEAAYPAEKDRQAFLHGKLAGAKPSYGHMALATLMRAGLLRMVWTTNFDALVADGCAKVYDTTSALTTAALDAPDLAEQAIADERWPLEVKLHGDFRSRRLKNTDDELRHQDQRLRQALVAQCLRLGLVVAGYSGRDESIMDTLEEAVTSHGAFPSGLFWLHRGDEPPLPRVQRLLDRGKETGVEVALVSIENFDETLRDLMRLLDNLDTKALDDFAAERRHWSPATLPQISRRGWPVVRLNALPLVKAPNTCRRVVCEIGGTSDVRQAIDEAGVDVLAVRSRGGVLAFGADVDVRAAFEGNHISEFDIHTLDVRKQRYESSEQGLLRQGLTAAIVRERGLIAQRRRARDLLSPANPQEAIWQPLQKLVGRLSGTVNGHEDLLWREGIATRLGWADDRLWLLIEPITIFDDVTDDSKAAAADFARERSVKRYNQVLNGLIDFWAAHLGQDGKEMSAFNVEDGVDAVYGLSPITAFSRRTVS